MRVDLLNLYLLNRDDGERQSTCRKPHEYIECGCAPRSGEDARVSSTVDMQSTNKESNTAIVLNRSVGVAALFTACHSKVYAHPLL